MAINRKTVSAETNYNRAVGYINLYTTLDNGKEVQVSGAPIRLDKDVTRAIAELKSVEGIEFRLEYRETATENSQGSLVVKKTA